MKGGATYQDIKSNTVIKDPHTVSGMRWDDTDISGMQSVFDPLYRSVGSSVIQTENLKKFMFMGKNRGIAVMLGKHDIAIYIMKKIGFFHIGIPSFGLKLRYIKPVFIDLFTVQCQAIIMKSLRMLLLLQIKCLIKSLIFIVGINIFLKFFSGKLHNCPLSMWLFHNS